MQLGCMTQAQSAKALPAVPVPFEAQYRYWGHLSFSAASCTTDKPRDALVMLFVHSNAEIDTITTRLHRQSAGSHANASVALRSASS